MNNHDGSGPEAARDVFPLPHSCYCAAELLAAGRNVIDHIAIHCSFLSPRLLRGTQLARGDHQSANHMCRTTYSPSNYLEGSVEDQKNRKLERGALRLPGPYALHFRRTRCRYTLNPNSAKP